MSRASVLLAEAARQGIELRYRNGQFRVRPSKGAVPLALIAALRNCKEELRALLLSGEDRDLLDHANPSKDPSTRAGDLLDHVGHVGDLGQVNRSYSVDHDGQVNRGNHADLQCVADLYPADPNELLALLRGSGIALEIGPEGQLWPSLTDLPPRELYLVLKDRKPGLVALLREQHPTCPDCGSTQRRIRFGCWCCSHCVRDLTTEEVTALRREIAAWPTETAEEVLANLRLAGIKLWAKDNGRIGYEVPPGAIGKTDLLALLRQHGRELFKMLHTEGAAGRG